MKHRIAPIFVALAVVAACGDSAPRGTGDLADAPPSDVALPDAAPQFAGSIVGPAVPAEGSVLIVWIVASGSPDYAYKFGDGGSVGGQYTASLPGSIPADAFNNDGVAFGVVVLTDKGARPADGRVEESSLHILGVSRNGLVFRTAGTQVAGWRATFPVDMLSCARCIGDPDTNQHDSLAPAACSEVTIDTDPDASACDVF
jgi:hypothetical protein